MRNPPLGSPRVQQPQTFSEHPGAQPIEPGARGSTCVRGPLLSEQGQHQRPQWWMRLSRSPTQAAEGIDAILNLLVSIRNRSEWVNMLASPYSPRARPSGPDPGCCIRHNGGNAYHQRQQVAAGTKQRSMRARVTIHDLPDRFGGADCTLPEACLICYHRISTMFFLETQMFRAPESQAEDNLPSIAERKAIEAQSLRVLSRFNLAGVRETLKPLLNEIGRHGIFSEYTRHDISHVDTLLGMLDWIVVPKTKELMTSTDWMLVVLAIYFHDAGLIVTKKEFAERHRSSFVGFREEILGSKTPSAYKERVEALSPDDRERFLYQEFVRTNHAERIKRWINSELSDDLGVAAEVRNEISSIVAPLDATFREDLALICQSHHSDDLGDLKKYNPQRTYGNARHETANLQFVAILLRTVDLLHVTQDRAPSVAFRLATPADPKSIEEWSKQMPVVSVRKSPPRDEAGNVEPNAIPDTVAVSGTFHDPLARIIREALAGGVLVGEVGAKVPLAVP